MNLKTLPQVHWTEALSINQRLVPKLLKLCPAMLEEDGHISERQIPSLNKDGKKYEVIFDEAYVLYRIVSLLRQCEVSKEDIKNLFDVNTTLGGLLCDAFNDNIWSLAEPVVSVPVVKSDPLQEYSASLNLSVEELKNKMHVLASSQ